jgi:Apea-like HEPN
MSEHPPLSDEPRDVELWDLVRGVINEAREHVRELRRTGEYIGRHFNFPELGVFESGFPNVSHDRSVESAPIDYSSPFGLTRGRWTKVAYDELPSLLKLFDYARERDEFKSRFVVLLQQADEETAEPMMRISVAALVLDVFDHLMHTAGDDFDNVEVRAAWLPVEAGLLAEQLPVEVHVPIVLSHFETRESVELQPDIRIEPIPLELQLARVPDVSWGSAVHSTVLAAATHSFVFPGYSLPEDDPRGNLADRPGFYPLDRIDKAFSALRLVAGIHCGYAHIFLRPVGWTRGYFGPISKVIEGPVIRRYPAHFDNWGWLAPRRTVTDAQLAEVGDVLSQLHGAPPHLQLAARRLSAAMLREEEDDAIVDTCIGLEAALGDETPTEMTHKLALRTAAVIATTDKVSVQRDPLVTFRITKRLYAWRSKLVHGGGGSEKARRRFEQLGGGPPAVMLAVNLLRDGLRAVLARSDLQTSSAIDEGLILGAMKIFEPPAKDHDDE